MQLAAICSRDADALTLAGDETAARAAAAAAAGDDVELVELEGDHFDVVDPRHAAWRAVVERLPALLA